MESVTEILTYTRLSLNGGCMYWKGGCNSKGYGSVKYQGKVYATHKLVYILTKGPVPKGLQVMHTCNSPKCLNPEHLILGSNSDNQRQRALQGRYDNKLGIVGVTYEKIGKYERYTARGTINGERRILYRGPSFEEAIAARKTWEAAWL